ncbi:MAG: amidohydrolase family protein [Candidatus Aminicenantales bacterium]
MRAIRQRFCRAALTGFAIFLLFSVNACRRDREQPAAEVILKNAAVYTLDSSRPWAEAVAIAGGKIVFVGASSEAEKYRAEGTKVLDLAGKMVLPGFQDSHVHLISGGMELALCDLNDLQTKEQILARIRAYAAENPEKDWITGGGWALPVFPEANPSKEELDAIVSDRPAFLSAADGHSAWVNSRALELAGITEKTPDPEDGHIERKPGTNEPSGTLREAAMGIVSRLIPEPTAEEYLNGLRAGLALANRFGITSIIEASADDQILDAYAAFDRSGDLSVRVLASIYVDPEKGPAQVDELVQKRERYRGRILKATDAKIFADGVIESHTAALLEPYLDRPGDPGRPILENEEFNRLAVALDKAGFQIHVHAIGDRAVRMALDAFEAASGANGPRDARHHICHLELIDPADIPRFGGLGVVANFQALWAYPDTYITQLTEPILGPERSARLYPIGSVVRSGGIYAGGSDWSVSSLNPLDAIQVAVTRRDPADPPGPAWLPQELIDLPTAVAAYTANGAFLSFEEETRGSLEPGKAADLVVLDRNLFKIPPEEIHSVRVVLTVLEGKVVYSAESAPVS